MRGDQCGWRRASWGPRRAGFLEGELPVKQVFGNALTHRSPTSLRSDSGTWRTKPCRCTRPRRKTLSPLRGPGAGHLDDPRGVEHAGVDRRAVGVEASGQGLQGTLALAAVLCWQVDREEQVIAVAAVGNDRRPPAGTAGPAPDVAGQGIGLGLLGIGGRDASDGPGGITVDQEPAPAHDLAVVGQFAFAGRVDVVVTPADQVADERIGGEVHAPRADWLSSSATSAIRSTSSNQPATMRGRP